MPVIRKHVLTQIYGNKLFAHEAHNVIGTIMQTMAIVRCVNIIIIYSNMFHLVIQMGCTQQTCSELSLTLNKPQIKCANCNSGNLCNADSASTQKPGFTIKEMQTNHFSCYSSSVSFVYGRQMHVHKWLGGCELHGI
jgi:hypothetical protein